MKTLCSTCDKSSPGKTGCGIQACLDVARKEGASVAVGFGREGTTVVVMCSEYREGASDGDSQ